MPRLPVVLIATGLVALAATSPLAAQDPAAEPRIARARAALAPLAPLVGHWEGPAEAVVGRGEKLALRQYEDVVWGSKGTVLVVRGTGRRLVDGAPGAIAFEATAMIWFDEERGQLQMRAHNDGRSIVPQIELRPDTLIWEFPVPGGRVRYTIAYTAESWHEIGEFLRPDAPPIRTIEMRLTRPAR